MSPLLQISDLTKRYGRIGALEGIHLSIERGSVTALLGPNGAGKSTLFGCVLGLTVPTAGAIRWQGRPITGVDRAGFGYVAEQVALYPHRTTLENAMFFAGLKGQSMAEVESQIDRVGLRPVRERKVRQLSKGMLQRLGLAIALCGQPQLLVLDEPFNGLDPALLDALQSILCEERARGATLWIATHTMSAIAPLASHVAILLRGRLAAFNSVSELRAEHGHVESLENIYHQVARRERAATEVFA